MTAKTRPIPYQNRQEVGPVVEPTLIKCIDWMNSKFGKAEYTGRIRQNPLGGRFGADTRNWAEAIVQEFPESELPFVTERPHQAETE